MAIISYFYLLIHHNIFSWKRWYSSLECSRRQLICLTLKKKLEPELQAEIFELKKEGQRMKTENQRVNVQIAALQTQQAHQMSEELVFALGLYAYTQKV